MRILLFIYLIFLPFVNGMEKISIVHNGEERTFLLYVPSVIKDSYNLVIGLHGFTGSASGFEKETTGGFNLYAEENGLIVAYPQGKYFYQAYEAIQADGSAKQINAYLSSWNHLGPLTKNNKDIEICADTAQPAIQFPSCKDQDRCHWTSCVDDSDFIKTVAMKLTNQFSINKKYVMGLSNGGMMAQLIGCDYPDIFDGVINIVGMHPHKLSCTPDSPIDLLIYGSLFDMSVPPISINSSGGYFYEPLKDTALSWSNQFNCKNITKSKKTQPFDVSETHYFNCDNNVSITAIINNKAAHSWPGITPNEGYCRDSIQSEISYNNCKDIKKIAGSRYLLDRYFKKNL